jgi:hypothetical protein
VNVAGHESTTSNDASARVSTNKGMMLNGDVVRSSAVSASSGGVSLLTGSSSSGSAGSIMIDVGSTVHRGDDDY